LQHVHDPGRLDMLAACASFIGTVSSIRFDSSFDDLKLIVVPDAPFLRYLRPANQGHVVVDVIATDLDTVHAVPQGTHAIFFGAWVLNRANGQVEMLPTFKIQAPNLDPRKVVAVPQLTAGLEAHRSQKLDIRASAPADVGGDLRMSSFRLVWTAAKDNVTPSSRIAYDIYQTTSQGAESFSRATYTTRRGVTSFVTPRLPSNGVDTYYFVVRARDAAGNRDRNRHERPGRNLCL